MGAPLEAEEADVGDVVLAARVGAAGDVDAHPAHLGEAGLLERVTDVGGEAARLRDREVAGVGAGARHDVACELGAGLGHAELGEPGVQLGELLLGEAAQHEVLAVGDAHLDAELALDGGEAAELVGGDVAEAAPRVGAHRAVGPAAHDVGGVPLLQRGEPRELHRGGAGADEPAVGGDLGAHAGGRVALLVDDRGHAARVGRRGDQELALLEDALAQLVGAHGVDEPLQAGPQLVVAVAVVVLHPQDRLDGGAAGRRAA